MTTWTITWRNSGIDFKKVFHTEYHAQQWARVLQKSFTLFEIKKEETTK